MGLLTYLYSTVSASINALMQVSSGEAVRHMHWQKPMSALGYWYNYMVLYCYVPTSSSALLGRTDAAAAGVTATAALEPPGPKNLVPCIRRTSN